MSISPEQNTYFYVYTCSTSEYTTPRQGNIENVHMPYVSNILEVYGVSDITTRWVREMVPPPVIKIVSACFEKTNCTPASRLGQLFQIVTSLERLHFLHEKAKTGELEKESKKDPTDYVQIIQKVTSVKDAIIRLVLK